MCELQGWHILNGAKPGPPACETFRRGNAGSCIDLIMSNNATHSMAYDRETMAALSDHILVMAAIRTSYLHRNPAHPTVSKPQVVYKWAEGTDVRNYTKSATSWQEFTQRPEFTNDLQALVNDNTCSNDDRAAAVEKYILNKAVETGVVKEFKFTQPRNPNKWGKTLAPWFNDKCKEAK